MVCTRLPTAFLVLFRGGFTWREQVFIASSWIPKVSMVLLLFLCNLPTLVNAGNNDSMHVFQFVLHARFKLSS